MSIISICGVGFLCLCATVVVRDNGYKTFSVILSCLGALLLLLYSMSGISEGLSQLFIILEGRVNIRHADVVVKSFGIAFVCEVSSDCIREVGSNSIAAAIEFAAKVEIIILCLSPMVDLINGTLSLISIV